MEAAELKGENYSKKHSEWAHRIDDGADLSD